MTTRATDTADVVRFGAIDGKSADSYPDLTTRQPDVAPFGFVRFQEGPVKEAGVNGTSMEIVLQVIIDRLEGYQRGPFPCIENENAREYMLAAMAMLDLRTRTRRMQGVEGVNQPHESESSILTEPVKHTKYGIQPIGDTDIDPVEGDESAVSVLTDEDEPDEEEPDVVTPPDLVPDDKPF